MFYGQYDDNQFGFRPRSSTQCALLTLQSYVLKASECKPPLHTFAISFDLQKAFDRINHDILITILADLHFPIYLLKLFQNYLINRTETVFFNNYCSEPLPIPVAFHKGLFWDQSCFAYIFILCNLLVKISYVSIRR